MGLRLTKSGVLALALCACGGGGGSASRGQADPLVYVVPATQIGYPSPPADFFRAEWPRLLVSDIDGNTLVINEWHHIPDGAANAEGQLQVAILLADGRWYNIETTYDGLPEELIASDGTVVVYRNWTDSSVDIGITSDGSYVDVYRSVPIDPAMIATLLALQDEVKRTRPFGEPEKSPLASDSSLDVAAVKKYLAIAGLVVKSAICGAAIISSAGALAPACLPLAIDVGLRLVEALGDAHDEEVAIAQTAMGAYDCAKVFGAHQWDGFPDCTSFVLDLVETVADQNRVKNPSYNPMWARVQAVESHMDGVVAPQPTTHTAVSLAAHEWEVTTLLNEPYYLTVNFTVYTAEPHEPLAVAVEEWRRNPNAAPTFTLGAHVGSWEFDPAAQRLSFSTFMVSKGGWDNFSGVCMGTNDDFVVPGSMDDVPTTFRFRRAQ